MTNPVLRRSPSGPLVNADGAARIQIEQQTIEIPEGLASTDLVANGDSLPTWTPLTTAEGSPVNLEAQFDDCQVGDLIQITGWNGLIGPTSSTSALARYELAQGGTPEAPPSVFVGDVNTVHVNGTERLRQYFAHVLEITEAGTAVVRVAGSSLSNATAPAANVTTETDQGDSGVTRGYYATLTRLTNVNSI